MTLEELLAQLATHAAADVAAALQTSAPAHFQEVYNKGFAKAKTEYTAKVAEKEAEITRLQGDLSSKETELADLKAKTPDVNTVDQKWKDHVKDLEAKHAAKISEYETRIQQERFNIQKTQLVAGLIKSGIDSEYAELVAVNKYSSRIRFDKDGNPEFLQKNDIPFTGADTASNMKFLLDEIVAETPAKFKASGADAGSGASAGGAGSKGYTPEEISDSKRETGIYNL